MLQLDTVKETRKSYLDFLRIIACFFVIFNHSEGYLAFQTADNTLGCFISMFLAMLSRINVPLFFMISGSLLLDRDIGYKEIFSKRLPRFVLVTVVCSVLVYLAIFSSAPGAGTEDFIRKFLSADIAIGLWYLYAYIGFLCMLPFLRAIAKHLTTGMFFALLVLHALFSTCLPIVNYLLSANALYPVKLTADFQVPLMTTKAIFYPLLGYYLDHKFEIRTIKSKHVWFFSIVIVISIFTASAFTYHQGIRKGFTQDFVQLLDYVLAISIFLLVKYWFANAKKMTASKAIPFVGVLTFGIYLLDPVCEKLLIKLLNSIVPVSQPLLNGLCWSILSMLCGGFITWVLRRIPVMRKIL